MGDGKIAQLQRSDQWGMVRMMLISFTKLIKQVFRVACTIRQAYSTVSASALPPHLPRHMPCRRRPRPHLRYSSSQIIRFPPLCVRPSAPAPAAAAALPAPELSVLAWEEEDEEDEEEGVTGDTSTGAASNDPIRDT